MPDAKQNGFQSLTEAPAAVFLDLDNTLYPYDPCDTAGRAALGEIASHLPEVDRFAFNQAYDQGRAATHQDLHGTAASHSRLLYLQKALEQIHPEYDIRLLLSLYETYWSAYMATMRLFPGVEDFLRHLEQRGIPTVVVTDLTAHIQLRKLVRLGLSDLLSAVVTSEEAGREKPDPRVFHRALRKAGDPCPARVWMIGDNEAKDIAGANQAGLISLIRLPTDAGTPTEANCRFDDFQALDQHLRQLPDRRGYHGRTG